MRLDRSRGSSNCRLNEDRWGVTKTSVLKIQQNQRRCSPQTKYLTSKTSLPNSL
jgi:hypothetical protein